MRRFRRCLSASAAAIALAMTPALAVNAQQPIDAQVSESTSAAAIAPAKIAEPPLEPRQGYGGDDIEQLIDLIAPPSTPPPAPPPVAKPPVQAPPVAAAPAAP